MRAYHQGQLDFLCAIYAVINALTLCYGINLAEARKILAQSLARLSQHQALWQVTLNNQSDFHWMVRSLLKALDLHSRFALRAVWPFAATPPEVAIDLFTPEHSGQTPIPAYHTALQEPPLKIVWDTLQNWLPGEHTADAVRPKTAVLRFFRYLPGLEEPIVRHWTTARHKNANTISLFDATPDKAATHALPLGNLMPSIRSSPDSQTFLYIEPASICLLERTKW